MLPGNLKKHHLTPREKGILIEYNYRHRTKEWVQKNFPKEFKKLEQFL